MIPDNSAHGFTKGADAPEEENGDQIDRWGLLKKELEEHKFLHHEKNKVIKTQAHEIEVRDQHIKALEDEIALLKEELSHQLKLNEDYFEDLQVSAKTNADLHIMIGEGKAEINRLKEVIDNFEG